MNALARGGLPPGREHSGHDVRRARRVRYAVCAGGDHPTGRVTTGDAALCRHPRRSVLESGGIGSLAQRVTDAAFADVHETTVPGRRRDIVHTVVGTAPEETQ
ncbi:hypothetical protein P3102_22040 [Amycolatopsis sp. QT-25]|uniref:hypothetical protein n=1 Tax=Amycolatopsis sp. QT-25 TaxID=3034022 RepID=UPI0023EBA1FD|nr:hypothetical protein [Amycolatopsis sp. QT-25]WET76788.1 hypothetical protein P3102_22040 [Amycolatopsis sp. QT-25]